MSNVEPVVESPPEVTIPLRTLGNTWEGWNGEVEENNGDLATSPWYFLGLASIVLMLFTALVWFGVLLAGSQLVVLPSWIGRTIIMGVMGVLSTVNTMFLLMGMTVLTGRNFVPFFRGRHIALSAIIPWTVKAGKLFGLSQDRMTHSVLRVGNVLTAVNQMGIQREKLLILLPRCLNKTTWNEINLVISKYNLEFHTCAVGPTAKQMLSEKKPQGVIAVGCERDLFAVVQDVQGTVPVFAIANKRPEGPCHNTSLNLMEMENAIRMFLGKKPLPLK